MEQPRLLDRVREAIRVRHYSLRTEQTYIQWIRRYILFHHKRHPDEMGEKEITAFLSYLAVTKQVAASTRTRHCLPSCSSTRRCSIIRLTGWTTWFGQSVPSACPSY